MDDVDVRIVTLEPMRVVSALGFGAEPEPEAWRMIEEFARDHGLEWPGDRRFFGFNNPDPSPGSPNYGYEQWMTVADDVTAAAPYEIKHVPEGRYATLRFTGLPQVGDAWKALAAWMEESGHQISCERDRCLEEMDMAASGSTPEEWVFDLYLGIDD